MTKTGHFNFTNLCIAAAVLRVILLVYGEWQDRHLDVKYTDIDYLVFTDAARHITQGESPYARATYRYTPMLAILLTPNIYGFFAFGKCLFALADLGVGYLIHQILVLRGMPSRKALWFDALWLLNPMVANISTRGNAESLLSMMVLGTLYFVLTRQFYPACAAFGLAVHFKIYPVIYAAPLVFLLDARYGDPVEWPTVMWSYQQLRLTLLQRLVPASSAIIQNQGRQDGTDLSTSLGRRHRAQQIMRHVILFLTPTRIMFAITSATVFFVLTGAMYQL